MQAYLIVFLGAGIGGAFRHCVNVWSARLFGLHFPFGTFIVNIVGSLAMGLIAGYFMLQGGSSQHWRLFLATGILSGLSSLMVVLPQTAMRALQTAVAHSML
jgi:CrcB protein